MATTGLGGGLTAQQIDQIRRWASKLSSTDGELRDGIETIVRLAGIVERVRAQDGDGSWGWDDIESNGSDETGLPVVSGKEVAAARRLAGQLAAVGDPDHRAAARALDLLCGELEPEGAPGGAGEPPALEAARGGGFRQLSPHSFLPAAVVLLAAIALVVAARAAAPNLDAGGPPHGQLVGRAGLKALSFSIGGDPTRFDGVRWTLDGADVTSRARRSGGRLVLRPGRLADGTHEVRVRTGGFALWSAAGESWRFTVDTAPPAIGVPGDLLRATVRAPFVLHGTVRDATRLTVNGKPLAFDGGHFVLRYTRPPAGFVLSAEDAAGNVATRRIVVSLAPRKPRNPIRSVHVSADAWANDQLRSAVLQLIDDKRINSVELDLKDESGIVGWSASVPLAQQIGAVQPIYDLAAAVKQLHARGVRVIGRLVVFRDPVLADWAWKHKKRGEVIQTPGGKPYSGGYCTLACFTNFANPVVRSYNIDIGVAAAKVGVDDVLYDYIRRPDGPIDSMRFPSFSGDPSSSIVAFLAATRRALAPTKTLLGASVFGISVSRPDEVAQDVPKMAHEVDYVAPLIYPSHWAAGEYGVANPNAQPYDIVLASLRDFRKAVDGTGARLVPWLQDFSLGGVEYGPAQVRAQIAAAQDAGVKEWILWDPNVTYTAAALDRKAPLPTTGEKPAGVSAEAIRKLPPNELGEIPVLMYHQIRPDPTSEYDKTPDDFRAELDRLYREGYRPITARDLVDERIDIPKGTTPVVLTFDDGYPDQAALRADGTIDPHTAVGILLSFARTHPGFRPVATFYVNQDPFVAGDRAHALLQWLVRHGFEIGNHTKDHANLAELDARSVQAEFVTDDQLIHGYLPGAPIETMALPYGVLPKKRALVLAGEWEGERYAFKGVMLVGAEPAPSPYSSQFDPAGIPRIRSATQSVAYDSRDWLDRLADNPKLRYVSDGDPKHITFPKAVAGNLAPAYEAKAKQY